MVFDYNPSKYIEFYSVRIVAVIAIFSSLLWAFFVDFALFTIYNSSAYHPATNSEIASYIAIVLSSGLAHLVTAMFVLRYRDTFASSVPPFVPTPIIGALLFLVFFLLYGFVFGLD